ncbi:MAG: ABC transporter permease subunit, partial [Luteolibacter sp.]
MIRRLIGIVAILLGTLAVFGEIRGIAFPTARWFFNVSRDLSFLHYQAKNCDPFLWFGWLASSMLILGGIALVWRSFYSGPPNPVTERRFKRFRQIRRGYLSMLILLSLAGVAALDQAVVGKRALAVQYDGKWVFPAFLPNDLKNSDFGDNGERADALVNYRELKRRFERDGSGKVIMPLVPYDPAGDTLPPRSRALVIREGIYYEVGHRNPYSGLAARYHDVTAGRIHIRYTLRDGLISGPADGWDAAGAPVYHAAFLNGVALEENFSGQGSMAEFEMSSDPDLRAIKYHPAPPMPSEGHLLGTTSQGNDVVAYLFGGLQVNFKAAMIYLPLVYVIGMTMGLLMGYFGGWFDLVVQRLIEIFSNMPFLFVVIILSSFVPDEFKGLPVVLSILTLFGWMGMTYLMRTAAYREKARDYVAAARVLGAGTPRVLLRHLLPNTVAIIVTLVPF